MADRRARSNTQDRIFEFIKENTREKGYPPTVREICAAMGLSSTSTVHAHLSKLEKRGLIKRDPTKPRAIEVVDFAKGGYVSIPLVGKVAAGIPILALENIEETFSFPSSLLPGTGEYFMLTVVGDSMIEIGINSGDMVIVHCQPNADNGEIIVAMIDDETTVKRFFQENGHVRLQPENHTMKPIIVPNVSILGTVVGLYRKM